MKKSWKYDNILLKLKENKTCPKCGATTSYDNAKFCGKCRYKFGSCPECGEELDGDENFCPNCGYDIKNNSSLSEDDKYDTTYNQTKSAVLQKASQKFNQRLNQKSEEERKAQEIQQRIAKGEQFTGDQIALAMGEFKTTDPNILNKIKKGIKLTPQEYDAIS